MRLRSAACLRDRGVLDQKSQFDTQPFAHNSPLPQSPHAVLHCRQPAVPQQGLPADGSGRAYSHCNTHGSLAYCLQNILSQRESDLTILAESCKILNKIDFSGDFEIVDKKGRGRNEICC